MNSKTIFIFSLATLLIFSQIALPNSFADNTSSIISGTPNQNGTSTTTTTTSTPPVTDQSSTDPLTNSSSSTTTTTSTPPVIDQSSTNPSTNSSAPTQPAPTQPAPTQPAPTQPAPTQPAPTQPAPTQPAPTQPAPTQWSGGSTSSSSSHTPSDSQTFNQGTSPNSNNYTSTHNPNTPSQTTSHTNTYNPGTQSNSNNYISTHNQNTPSQTTSHTNTYNPGTQSNSNNYISTHNQNTPSQTKFGQSQINDNSLEARLQHWFLAYRQSILDSRVPSHTSQYQQYSPSQTTNQPTSTTVAPNSATSNGGQVTFTATVTDSSSSNTPTGTISWSDGGVGGTFGSTTCPLYSASCTVSYTPSVNSPSLVTITATYGGDSVHQSSSGSSSLSVNVIHSTTTTITPNPATVNSDGPVTFTATVTDISEYSNPLTGTISWSDGNAGGVFSQTYCYMSSGSCTVSYTPSVNSQNTVTITANYAGDGIHQASSGTTYLSVNVIHSTTTTIAPNPVTITSGSTITFTASVHDVSSPYATLLGLVSWSDGNVGGTFSTSTCILSNNNCSLTYTPPSNLPSDITITANYAGDSTHSASYGTSSVLPSSLTPASSLTLASYTSSNIQTDKTSYTPGNTVTITVNPQGAQEGQNVAILVTDPSSNIVASRTAQVDSQGNAKLLVGLPLNSQAGIYRIAASALVSGNYLNYPAEFTVVSQTSQSSGVSIVSIQPTDQQGDKTVTAFSKGTTGYAKVVLSSNSTQTSLITVNLVGSDGTSLGVGSVKTSLGAGNSEIVISFYIPSSASIGTGNVYADAYSDWPSNGGVPLTAETSSPVSIG